METSVRREARSRAQQVRIRDHGWCAGLAFFNREESRVDER